MTLLELEAKIKGLYNVFFEDMKIDKLTGKVNGTNLRFSGLPYIGASYVDAPKRILFIPLDTGVDELFNENKYRDFDSRRDIIEKAGLNLNPHMAGVYAMTLFILKNQLGENSAWDALWEYKDKYKTAKAIRSASDFLPDGLLKMVAFENRYRFVTIGRGSDKKERGGSKDRKWIDAKRESELLMAEFDVFRPDIIVFQGKHGLWNFKIDELKKKYQVVIINHPSCWQRGADRLQYIVSEIESQIML